MDSTTYNLKQRLAGVSQSLLSIGDDNHQKGITLKLNDENILRMAVLEHVEIIRLIREFDKLLTDIFLIQVLQTTIVSTMCFYAASKIDDIMDVPKFVAIISATYMQLYIYCWLGEEISQHSNDIHHSIYASKWYQCDLKVRKSLNIFETFTKAHFKLNGGHIFTIHLETFLLMLKESFSYFMVLRAIVK
ncbi:unnamed protein product [Nezara viridula]|uniref:Odorant receptor n=2 Tax=Nezara viridula TaxID=85310 RepID=A0A9P0HNA8_NEZVI|nr:unnamed protein product [Nezara viridula]